LLAHCDCLKRWNCPKNVSHLGIQICYILYLHMLFKNMFCILAFGLATVFATFQKIGQFVSNSGHSARGCLCSDYVESYVMGMFLFCFLFWYSCRAIIFCNSHWHNYFLLCLSLLCPPFLAFYVLTFSINNIHFLNVV
jgi:hypothetical protein